LKKGLLFIVICLISLFIYAEEISLIIEYTNGQKEEILIDKTAYKIENFKVHLYIYTNKGTQIFQHSKQITKIDGINQLPNLIQLDLIYTLKDGTDLSFIISDSLRILHVSGGPKINNFDFLNNLPNLEVLGLNSVTFDNMDEWNLLTTKLTYFETSDINLKEIPMLLFPSTLKYFNIQENILYNFSDQNINTIINNGIIVIYDYKNIESLRTYTRNEISDSIPDEYIMNRP